MKSSKKMSKKIQILILGVMISVGMGIAIYQHFHSERLANPESHDLGKTYRSAPEFHLSDQNGKKYRLKDFSGNLVILHFWATWCPPCLDEIQKWVVAASHYSKKNVRWVAISLDQNWADVNKVLPREKLPKNVISLIDSTGKVAEEYGSFQFPETYLLTPDLKIFTKWVGPQQWPQDDNDEHWNMLIEKLSANKE